MEEEKKKMSKETKKFLIIISSFIAVVIIVGVVFGVVFPQLNKKEVQTSSQLENENIQEEKKEENTIPDYKNTYTTASNNSYGMRFNKTISEFCENYNIKLEKVYEQEGLDKVTMSLHTLDKSKFSLMNNVNTENGTKFNQYGFTGLNYYMFLFTEPNNENIVYACVSFDSKGVSDSNGLIKFIGRRIQPAMIMALTDFSYTTVLDNLQKITSEKSYSYFKDNVAYSFYLDGTFYHNYVYAMSEEKYNSILNGNANNNQTSDNSVIKTDIQDRIDFFNSYYYWNFHPTDEQMQQMVEFANSTSNFTNDTLADFIIDKGWLPDSGTGTVSSNNSSSTTNNGNSSSSNKNTSSSNNGNTSKEENPQPVLNVTVDPYSYLSKEEQNRIYENNETKKFNIVIKFNGKTVKSDTITYTGDNYIAPTYENIKVDSESGTLTVEVNGETIKYTDGAKSVEVSMYFIYDEWRSNTFNFYDITKMMG